MKEATMNFRKVSHNSILCAAPPHILHEIAKRGTQPQREFALDTIGADHSFRSRRAAFQLTATGAHKLLHAAPVGGEAHITIYNAGHRQRLPGHVIANPNESSDVEVVEA